MFITRSTRARNSVFYTGGEEEPVLAAEMNRDEHFQEGPKVSLREITRKKERERQRQRERNLVTVLLEFLLCYKTI